jgi:hypothetical protein
MNALTASTNGLEQGTVLKENTVSKKKRSAEDGQFEEFVDSVDTSGIDGLIDPEDIPGPKKRETHSKHFTDRELAAMPSYTSEELAALPAPWTKRGEMISADTAVIQGLADKNRVAARIFVTGEVSEAYIGDAATRLLVNVNDVYYKNKAGAEPLFIQTRADTVRMARFDPAFVWRCFHPDILVGLVQDEIDRLGVNMDPWKMDYFDFYQNMVAAIKAAAQGEAVAMVRGSSLDDFYHGVYLSCLLLFGKPGYMDVPVAEHFAQKEAADFLRGAEVCRLNGAALEKLEKLREEYGNIRFLTNPEMHFAVDLISGAIK